MIVPATIAFAGSGTLTAEQFITMMTVAAPSLTPEDRHLACRFVAAMGARSGAHRERASRNRRSAEREWEERELARAGDDVGAARRSREPA
jgi:hypothetical protein